MAIYRAALSLLLGDPAATLQHAREALGRLDPGDEVAHAAASALLGLASWTEGDLDAAHAAYVTCSASFLREGYLSDVLGCAIPLGDIRVTQGRLREATDTFHRALHVTGQDGDVQRASALRGAADVYVGLGMLHCEHDDLAAARECLERSRALGEHNGLPQHRYRWRVAMARVLEAEGDADGAAALLDEAEQVYVGDFLPDVRPVAALKARSALARGRLQDASDWVRRRGLTPEDSLSYQQELEQVTLARVLIARSAAERSEELLGQASRLLDRLLEAAEAGGRWGTVIEVLVLQALAHQAAGDIESALASLQRALTLAEPEGYVRVFLDEGAPVVRLLEAAAQRGVCMAYVRALLGRAAGVTRSPGRTPVPAPANGLVDALSERELVVLRLLATDLTGPEIARELVVSLNTVRTHTRNVYAKLGVSGRRAAVRRAEELDLVQVGRRRS